MKFEMKLDLLLANDRLSSFSFRYSLRYPFDWKTPAGYLVAFLAQAFGILCGASAFMQFLNLFFGSCWLFTFIAEDITKDSAAFNTAAKATNRNCVELMSRFCDMLQIYSDAKE